MASPDLISRINLAITMCQASSSYFADINSHDPHNNPTMLWYTIINSPTLQMRKWRHRENKSLVQGFIAQSQRNKDFRRGSWLQSCSRAPCRVKQGPGLHLKPHTGCDAPTGFSGEPFLHQSLTRTQIFISAAAARKPNLRYLPNIHPKGHHY